MAAIQGLFTIGTTPYDLGASSFFQLEQFEVSYDGGRRLWFSEIATPSIAFPTWNLEDDVTLKFDYGTGGKLHFSGKIKKRNHIGQNQAERISYVAYGQQQIANDLVLVNGNGVPQVTFTVGTTVTSVNESGTPVTRTAYYKTVRKAIQDCFDLMRTTLATYGIPATIGTPGLDTFSVWLPKTTRLQNMGFVSAVQELVSHQPGKRVMYDDVTGTWIFPNLIKAPIKTLTINSINLIRNLYDMDSSSRYTAFFLMGSRLVDKVESETLEENWDVTREATWTLERADGAADPDELLGDSDYYWIYRRYAIPDGAPEPRKGAKAFVWRRTTSETPWLPVQAKIDWVTREVVTEEPLFGDGNPFIEGDAQGPTSVKISYLTDMVTLFNWVRYPGEGYMGTAYTMLGIQRTKIELVDPAQVTVWNASAKLAGIRDVIISGQLPIEGDPIEELLQLGVRIRLTHDTKVTGTESLSAMMPSYKYVFKNRGENQLTLSNDVSGLVRLR